MAFCQNCKSSKDLNVWVIPDPYYGYGHCPQVICSKCPDPTNIWMEKHPYEPRSDNRFLGLTECNISRSWVFDGTGKNPYICTDCKKQIPTLEHGHRYNNHKEEHFCLSCFDQRLTN